MYNKVKNIFYMNLLYCIEKRRMSLINNKLKLRLRLISKLILIYIFIRLILLVNFLVFVFCVYSPDFYMIDNLSQENIHFINNTCNINSPENYNFKKATYYQFKNPNSNELYLYTSIPNHESLEGIKIWTKLNKNNSDFLYHEPMEIKSSDEKQYKFKIDISKKNIASRVQEYFIKNGTHIFIQSKDLNILFFVSNCILIEIFFIGLNIYNHNYKKSKFYLKILIISVCLFLSIKSFRHLLWIIYIIKFKIT